MCNQSYRLHFAAALLLPKIIQILSQIRVGLQAKKMEIEKIIAENQGTIVDVRSYGEFLGGNVAGSINIPLNEIPERIEELKKLKAPLILCCASGMRSSQAQNFLSQQGIECYNGGSWLTVNYYKSISN